MTARKKTDQIEQEKPAKLQGTISPAMKTTKLLYGGPLTLTMYKPVIKQWQV